MTRTIIRILLFSILPTCGCDNKTPETVDDGIVTIGIYSGEGAAEGCVIAADSMFRWMGHTTKLIYSENFNTNKIQGIDIFYFPGGSTGPYLRDISTAGKALLLKTVEEGAGYIGTCAGALFACETQIWEGRNITSGQLGLFQGKGIGPNPEIYPYPEIGMCKVDFLEDNGVIESLDYEWIMFYNGPYFIPEENSNQMIVPVGNYNVTGRAAIIACEHGKGRVFLTGPHPEFEEDSRRDGLIHFKDYDDQGSDWPLMKQATDWCLRAFNH
jgi:glutamine amidotransferase-like uncharacterized protein